MSRDELEILLEKLRDGSATDEEVERVRELMEADESAFDLGLDEALAAEAGEIDLGHDVLAGIGSGLPVAEAVRDELSEEIPLAAAVLEEAGAVDVVAAVFAKLGLAALNVPVAEAVRAEAGSIDIAEAVVGPMDPRIPVAEAVRAEAGSVDLAAPVMDSLGATDWNREWVVDAVRSEAGTIDIADAVMAKILRPSVVAAAPEIPRPANRSFPLAALLLAAVALLSFVVGRLGSVETGGPIVAPVPVESYAALQFASGDEIRVDDLDAGEGGGWVDARDDAGGALIIWVTEAQL